MFWDKNIIMANIANDTILWKGILYIHIWSLCHHISSLVYFSKVKYGFKTNQQKSSMTNYNIL